MTTEELAAIRGAIERTDLFDEETLPLAFSDRKRLLAEVDRLRAENARLAAQERASGPETPQGHPSEGTGVPGPHGAAQAADLTPAEQAAAEELVRLSGPGGNPRWTAADFTYDARAVVAAVRPHHWREAAAFLRSIADENGVRNAADILDNAAADLNTESETTR